MHSRMEMEKKSETGWKEIMNEPRKGARKRTRNGLNRRL